MENNIHEIYSGCMHSSVGVWKKYTMLIGLCDSQGLEKNPCNIIFVPGQDSHVGD